MTDERTTLDGTETQPAPTADPGGSGPTSEQQTATDDAGPGLLKSAAAGLLGLAGLGAATGSASAAGSQHLVVAGRGRGKHTYEIRMGWPNEIYKSSEAGPNDRIEEVSGQHSIAHGEVWNWNVDTYTYTGPIESIEADGDVMVYFPDDNWNWSTDVTVEGRGGGGHDYSIATNHGDIDPLPNHTSSQDTDDGGPNSEQDGTPDVVNGTVWAGKDVYHVDGPVNRLHVKGDHVVFHVPCPGCDPP